MAKQILTRIKDELKAMQQSRDQEYIQTEIKWNNKRSFSVECFRKGDSDEIRDADGNIIYDDLDSACEATQFEVYYLVKGIDRVYLTVWDYRRFYYAQNMKAVKAVGPDKVIWR